MKTQINSLVRGDHRKSISGTSLVERMAISHKVREENPEFMTISLRGQEIKLKANWSLSRKSVDYFGEITLELYKAFLGDFGLPTCRDQKAFIHIFGDCTVGLETNSKKMFSNYIPESEIIIL
jgi:hypothetical protein